MKNSIDKMAEQFNSVEELQAYADAQYKTIQSLNERLNSVLSQVAELKAENGKLKTHSIIQNSVPEESQFKVTDEETVCVLQLAILKNHALERELVMDEVKRLEILCKTLSLIRGKVDAKPKEKDTSNLSTAELLAYMDQVTKDPQ